MHIYTIGCLNLPGADPEFQIEGAQKIMCPQRNHPEREMRSRLIRPGSRAC